MAVAKHVYVVTLPLTFIHRERDAGFEFCPFGRVGQWGPARSFADCAASDLVAERRIGRTRLGSASRGGNGAVGEVFIHHMRNCPTWHFEGDLLFVHAGVDPHQDLRHFWVSRACVRSKTVTGHGSVSLSCKGTRAGLVASLCTVTRLPLSQSAVLRNLLHKQTGFNCNYAFALMLAQDLCRSWGGLRFELMTKDFV